MIFDKACVGFSPLFALCERGVFWVTRAKENLCFEVLEALPCAGKILRDEMIHLRNVSAFNDYPEGMRRVVALVEIDGHEQEMVFLTNNLEWSAARVADLSRCRWSMEVFFKQIKQTLKLSDFLGHRAKAVRWQVWTALLVSVLPFGPFGCAQGTRRLRALSLSKRLRFLAYAHDWTHSFTRLFTLVRAALWRRWDLASLRKCDGTASGSFRFIATPPQPCCQGC